MSSAPEAGPLWWLARVEGWRFLLPADAVQGSAEGVTPMPVHHAPAWVAGLVHLHGRVWGVVDWGRFLGVCTARPGVIVLPFQPQGAAWALRVHALEPGPSQTRRVAFDSPLGPGAALEAAPMGAVPRARPTFAVARHEWVDAQGQAHHADELNLANWARHPRLAEARL